MKFYATKGFFMKQNKLKITLIFALAIILGIALFGIAVYISYVMILQSGQAPILGILFAIPIVIISSFVIFNYARNRLSLDLLELFGIELNDENLQYLKKLQDLFPRIVILLFIMLLIYKKIIQ